MLNIRKYLLKIFFVLFQRVEQDINIRHDFVIFINDQDQDNQAITRDLLEQAFLYYFCNIV